MNSFVLVAGFLASASAFAAPPTDSCHFYLERESVSQCGKQGYYLDFGYKLCSAYTRQALPALSPAGRDWFDQTRECLIREMRRVPSNLSCKKVPSVALQHHVSCYEETRYCNLSLYDRLVMGRAIASQSRDRGEFLGFLLFNARCAY